MDRFAFVRRFKCLLQFFCLEIDIHIDCAVRLDLSAAAKVVVATVGPIPLGFYFTDRDANRRAVHSVDARRLMGNVRGVSKSRTGIRLIVEGKPGVCHRRGDVARRNGSKEGAEEVGAAQGHGVSQLRRFGF